MSNFVTCTVHGENVHLDENFREGMIATRCTECNIVLEIRNVPSSPQTVQRHISTTSGTLRETATRPKPGINA